MIVKAENTEVRASIFTIVYKTARAKRKGHPLSNIQSQQCLVGLHCK